MLSPKQGKDNWKQWQFMHLKKAEKLQLILRVSLQTERGSNLLTSGFSKHNNHQGVFIWEQTPAKHKTPATVAAV